MQLRRIFWWRYSGSSTVNVNKLKAEIKESIINDDNFKAEVSKLVKVENPEVDTTTIETNVKNSIIENEVFKQEIAKVINTDNIKTSVKNDLKKDSEFKKELVNSVEIPEVDTVAIASTVETNIKEDEAFKSEIAKMVSSSGGGDTESVDTDKIKLEIKSDLKSDETFKQNIANLIETPTVDTDTLKADIENNIKEDSAYNKSLSDEAGKSASVTLKADEAFKSEIAGLVNVPEVDTNAIASTVETNIKEDSEFKKEICKLAQPQNFETLAKFGENESGELLFNGSKLESGSANVDSIISNLKADADFKSSIADSINVDNIKSDIELSADFVSDSGFGNIRYHNSKFQYNNGTDWVDIAPQDSNKFIINLVPQNMKNIVVFFDYNSKCIKIRFSEPSDTIVDGQLLCYVSGIKIIRKLGSEPESDSDGDLVLDIKRKDFGKYKNTYYNDTNIESVIGNSYYYKFFPYSNTGAINNCTENCASTTIKDAIIYGFRLDQNESDPVV